MFLNTHCSHINVVRMRGALRGFGVLIHAPDEKS